MSTQLKPHTGNYRLGFLGKGFLILKTNAQTKTQTLDLMSKNTQLPFRHFYVAPGKFVYNETDGLRKHFWRFTETSEYYFQFYFVNLPASARLNHSTQTFLTITFILYFVRIKFERNYRKNY